MQTKFFTLAIFLVSISSSAQNIRTSYIDSIVQRSLTTMPQAGVAVAVVQNGKVVHCKGYGVKSAETMEAVNENTLFCIASNSKAFTASAIGILVDQGKIKWDDKVVDYIPEFKMYDDYVTKNFTITDLLTHRSGLGLGAGDLMFIPDGADFTIDDIVRSFQYQKATSAFRTKYDYDNLLYIVAGEIIHRVSGKPWDEFIETEIFNPIGMKSSVAYRQNLKNQKSVALPHSSEGGKVEVLTPHHDDLKIFGAAGGIHASVDDLSKWMLVNLNEGKYGKGLKEELISKKSLGMQWKAHTNIYFNAQPKGGYNTHYRAYGLGWFLTDHQGYTIVSHTGGMPGMLSQTILIPELEAGLVVLTNAAPGGYSFVTVANEIKDELIGAKDRDWVMEAKSWIEHSESDADSVLDAVWAKSKANDQSKVNRSAFLGNYEDNWFGKCTVTEKEGKLWFVSQRSPKLNGEMFLYDKNKFAIRWEYQEMNCDAFAEFFFDDMTKAQRIQMKGISPNIDFSFDFHDLDLRRID